MPLHLPLLPVVGNAIYDYLDKERPRSSCDYVFLNSLSAEGLAPVSICSISYVICKAAHVRNSKGDRKGTHTCMQTLKTFGSVLWIFRKVRNASNSTINVRLGSLRRFIKYLSERKPEYLYLYSEATSVALLKTEKRKIEGLTKDAISAILDAVDTSTKSGKLYFTLIVFLYATAVRLDEALSLRMENLHLDGVYPHATIVGKGAKTRTVYLLKEAAEYLHKYKDFFFKSEEADGYFFFSRNGGWKAKLSQTAVQKALHKYAAIAHETCDEVPLNLHAHQFRHARASHWLDEGINIVQISHLLGHESLEVY